MCSTSKALVPIRFVVFRLEVLRAEELHAIDFGMFPLN